MQVSQVMQGSNHPYFYHYVENVRRSIYCKTCNAEQKQWVTKAVTTNIFNVKKSNLAPVTLKKISTGSNAKDCATVSRQFNGRCSVQYYIQMDENSSLDLNNLNKKEQGEYIVIGCIRWIEEVMKKSVPNSPVPRTLREGILFDTTGHMSLRVWGNHINKIKIIENQLYKITYIAIRKYYDTKLSATPMIISEVIERESTLYWPYVDIPNYLNHEKIEKEKFLKE